jgi:hypothetical protein
MKRINLILILIAIMLMQSCYTDTIDSLKTIVIQVPLNQEMVNFGNSKETINRDNLNNYPDYRNNKDRIKSITMYQAAYHANEVYPAEAIDQRFKSMDFFVEVNNKRYRIARFEEISVQDMYRIPHLDQVDDASAKEISNALLNNPEFKTISIFDPYGDFYYERILSTLVIVIKIEIEV